MRRILGVVAVVLGAAGVGMVYDHFDAHSAWLFCGLTTIIMAVFAANAAFNCRLARTLDEEFQAGYRVGYRAGRRAPLASRSVTSLDAYRQRRSDDARISQAPVRAVAGYGPDAGWPPPHPN